MMEDLRRFTIDSTLTPEIFCQTTKRVSQMWGVEYCPTSSILGSIISQDVISFIKDPSLLAQSRFLLLDSLTTSAKIIG